MYYRLAHEVCLEDVDGLVVLLSSKGDAAVLNSSGTYVICNLLSGQNDTEAAGQLARRECIEERTAREDVTLFLNELILHRYIEKDEA